MAPDLGTSIALGADDSGLPARAIFFQHPKQFNPVAAGFGVCLSASCRFWRHGFLPDFSNWHRSSSAVQAYAVEPSLGLLVDASNKGHFRCGNLGGCLP